MAAHFSIAELEQFDQGLLLSPKQSEVESHIATCATCCAELETIVDGPFVGQLRAQVAASNEADDDFPALLRQHPRYRVLDHLGAGGMGVVYRAEHSLLQRTVALKVLRSQLFDRAELRERFQQEMRAVAQLDHPNIVRAFDAELIGDTHVLVLEYVPGKRLDEVVAESGPLPVAEACDYALQILAGLQHAHERGLVHRDLKPGNVLLTPSGQIKILDFGLARVVSERTTVPHITLAGTMLGTPDFMAPEQASNAATADIRADLYAVGGTLYFLLSGGPPFPGGCILEKVLAHKERAPKPLSQLRADVSPALEAVVLRLLAKDPADRYASPRDASDALSRCAAEHGRRENLHHGWLTSRVVVAGVVCVVTLLAIPVWRAFVFRPPAAITPQAFGEFTYNQEQRAEFAAVQARPLTGHTDLVLAVAVSASGNLAVSGGANEELRLWDLPSGESAGQIAVGPVRSLAMSPQSTHIAVGHASGEISTWKLDGRSAEQRWQSHDGASLCVHWSAAGDQIISAGFDGGICVWNASDGNLVVRLAGHEGPATYANWLNNGQIISAGHDGRVIIWNEATRENEREFAHPHAVTAAALSPDKTRLATTCYDNRVRIWDVAAGETAHEMNGHTEPPMHLEYSRGGAWLATAGKDGSVRIWNANTGEVQRVFGGHLGESFVAAFADEQHVISGGQFGELWWWRFVDE